MFVACTNCIIRHHYTVYKNISTCSYVSFNEPMLLRYCSVDNSKNSMWTVSNTKNLIQLINIIRETFSTARTSLIWNLNRLYVFIADRIAKYNTHNLIYLLWLRYSSPFCYEVYMHWSITSMNFIYKQMTVCTFIPIPLCFLNFIS